MVTRIEQGKDTGRSSRYAGAGDLDHIWLGEGNRIGYIKFCVWPSHYENSAEHEAKLAQRVAELMRNDPETVALLDVLDAPGARIK